MEENIVDKVLAMNLNEEQIKRYMAGKDPHKFTSKSSSISGPSSHSPAESPEEDQSESSSDNENDGSSFSESDEDSSSSEEESD